MVSFSSSAKDTKQEMRIKITKGPKKTFGDGGYVHCLHCAEGFTDFKYVQFLVYHLYLLKALKKKQTTNSVY